MLDHNWAGTLHSNWNSTSKWIYFKVLNLPTIIVLAFGISDNSSVAVDKNETPAAKQQSHEIHKIIEDIDLVVGKNTE